MPSDSQDVAGRPASRSIVARSLVRFSRGAANVSLPGFTELGDMVKELVEDWKTADYNDNELVWLATRLEDLCSLIREFDMTEHPDVSNTSRKFHELKNSLAEEFERRPRSGIHGTEQRQRLLDNLNREIDRVVEMTLLRLALGQAQSSKHNPIDNFQVISAHEITDQIPVYDTVCCDWLITASKDISWPLAPDRPVATSSARQARLGRVPVRYKTFSSSFDCGVAAKVAEAELKHLSRCLHPNVARIIGVTKGYDGLNGYAVAADGISLNHFLLRVNSGAALVRFIRGIDNLVANMMDNLHYDIHAAHVTVKPNGQLTVFPVPCQGGSEFAISRHLGLLKDDYAVLNPAVREFLAIYWDRRKAAYWDPIYTGLFDSIMTLDWGTLTRLEMVRLAAKYKVLPYRHRYSWWEPDAPLHTVSVGDIGYVLRQDRRDTWSPIELKYACGIQWSYGCECGHADDWRAYTEGNRWTSITLHACGRSWLRWEQEEADETCYQRAKQARAYLRSQGVQVNEVQYCINVGCRLNINRIGSIEWPFERLYFHHNPSMRSITQVFWGFLSTSADPCSTSIVPGEVGLEITYDIWYHTYCLSDFWDYKYEEILKLGLASIPGSYPGSYVEEVSEDEIAEDKSCVPPL